jgi:hypothetical protein
VGRTESERMGTDSKCGEKESERMEAWFQSCPPTPLPPSLPQPPHPTKVVSKALY